MGLLLPADAALPPAPIGLPVDLNSADDKTTAKGGNGSSSSSSSSGPKPRTSSRKDRHRYSGHHNTPVAEVAPVAEAVVWTGDAEPPTVDAPNDSESAARGNRLKPPRPRPSRRNEGQTSSSSSSSSTSAAPNSSSGRDAASAAAEALARAGLARRSARQQRLVELLCAVGAVLRVPASQVQCRMSPTTGAVVWVASPAAAAHAAAQAEASLMQMAKSRHTASGAVAHQAREKRAASLAAPNQRASALCGEAVLGDAVVTLPGAVDGLAGLALGSNGKGERDSSSVLGAALHLAPVRFRREFLMSRATPTPPFEPQHCRRIRDAAARSFEDAGRGRNSSSGGGARGSSRGRPPVLKRPPPRVPSQRTTGAAGAGAGAASTAGDPPGVTSASQADPLQTASADVIPVSGAAQALAEAAYSLRREIAVNLGQRLRSCGDLTQHRSPYEEEADSSDEDDENDEDEKERQTRGGVHSQSLKDTAAGAAAAKEGLPTSLVAVFHGGHAVSLAHAVGVNVCLLPAVLSGVPATEASVHHLLRAELVARAAKHSLRVLRI